MSYASILSRVVVLLFAICLFVSVDLTIGRIDQTLLKVSPQSSLHTFDSYMQYPLEGDMNVSNHETFLMRDREYNLTAKVTAEDYATIVVKNATLTLSPSDSDGISFALKGRSRLLVTNSTINFARVPFGDCQIVLRDEAEANFTEATLAGWGYVVGQDASAVYVEKSDIGSGAATLHSPGVATYGASRLYGRGCKY